MEVSIGGLDRWLTMARLLAFVDIFVDSPLLGEVVNALRVF
jgi:hypothetical protein